MSFCTSCGARLSNRDAYCISCGQVVMDDLDAQVSVTARTENIAPWAKGTAGTQAVGLHGQVRRPRRLVPVLACMATLLLATVGAMFVLRGGESPRIGRALASDSESGADAGRVTPSAPDDGQGANQPRATSTAPPEGSTGPLVDLRPISVTADCTAPDAKDAANQTTTFRVDNVLDSDPQTAWRCPGSSTGHVLAFQFATPVTLREMGLIPGYAKIDPSSGEDRFGQNHTVTQVRWIYGGGSETQTIDTPGRSSSVLVLDSPAATTKVELRIDGIGNPTASRDFVAISDVTLRGTL